MPVIARANAKKIYICNNELFGVTKITKDFIFVEEHGDHIDKNQEDIKKIETPLDKLSKLFYVTYCVTGHKSQGSTFKKPYTIHEWSKFDNISKYVALLRSTNVKNTYIV